MSDLNRRSAGFRFPTRLAAGTLGRIWARLEGIAKQAGIDRTVVHGVLNRIWALMSGPVTILVIASRFSPVVQGYYYTFSSLLGLQVFFELGLGQVILQFASHEWARLRLTDDGALVGESTALSRLKSLANLSLRWYATAGIITVVGLGAGGIVFFWDSPLTAGLWVGSWLTLCALTGASLFMVPLWSVLEGCGQIAQVYLYRLVAAILNSAAIWLSILAGAELWTAPISVFLGCCWALVFLTRYRQFFRSIFQAAAVPGISWRREIGPLQWRVALTWMSGYLMFSLFTPMLFKFQGPAAAGQMGITWALVNTLSAMSVTWILTNVPGYGVLVARRDFAALDRLALRSTVAALCVASCGGAVIEGTVMLLNYMNHPLAKRLLPPLPTGLFLLATVFMQVSHSEFSYLRAHKREPLVMLAVVQGTLTALLSWLLGRRFGPTGMATGYLAVVIFLVLPVGTWVLFRCRSVWHHSGDGGIQQPDLVGSVKQ